MEKGTTFQLLSQVEETTLYEVYSDIQGNKFFYEDGELKHTEIYSREESYDLSGEIIENTKTN